MCYLQRRGTVLSLSSSVAVYTLGGIRSAALAASTSGRLEPCAGSMRQGPSALGHVFVDVKRQRIRQSPWLAVVNSGDSFTSVIVTDTCRRATRAGRVRSLHNVNTCTRCLPASVGRPWICRSRVAASSLHMEPGSLVVPCSALSINWPVFVVDAEPRKQSVLSRSGVSLAVQPSRSPSSRPSPLPGHQGRPSSSRVIERYHLDAVHSHSSSWAENDGAAFATSVLSSTGP